MMMVVMMTMMIMMMTMMIMSKEIQFETQSCTVQVRQG